MSKGVENAPHFLPPFSCSGRKFTSAEWAIKLGSDPSQLDKSFVSNTSVHPQKMPEDNRNSGRRERIWRASLVHGLEIMALIMALVLAICGGLAWRLAQGPVSLEFLKNDAELALVKVFEGHDAQIGTLQANWSAQDRSIVIAARDVQVLGENEQVLVQVPELDVGLSASNLIRGRAVIERIIAIGGEFSFVRRSNGEVGAGLGKPDQIAVRPVSSQAGQNASMASLPQVLSRLRVLAMRDAVLHFVDERSGADWVAPHANLRFERKGERITAKANGNIESQAGTATISISASSRIDFSRMNAELSLANAVPAALVPSISGAWQWIGGIDAPLSAQITFATGEDGLLRSADGHVSLAKGVFRKTQSITPIDSAELIFVFDPMDGAVSIEQAQLHSKLLTGALKGRITGLDPARLVMGEQVGFDLAFEAISVDPGDVFAAPLPVRLWLDGYYRPEEGAVEFKHFDLSIYDFSMHGSSTLTFPDEALDENAPLFILDARSDGKITPAQVLTLWPQKFAFGGRDWIRRNVISGQLHDFVMNVRLPQRVTKAKRLENDMLTLSFAFDEAVSHFVSTMTPLSNGEGTAVLRGNRFDLNMKSARIRNSELTDGFVQIPRLSPKGVVARFGGHSVGQLEDLIQLLDEKPLEFVSKYGLSPDAITGQGETDFTISRPMRVNVPARKVGFSATGAYKNIRVAGLIGGQDITDASATFSVDPDGMVVEGNGKVGSVPGRFTWQERFFPQNEPRTRLAIDVTTDAQIFDDLGIPTRLFLDGPVGLQLQTTGEGINIKTATLSADLTDARLTSPGGDWEKPAGQEGSAELQIKRRADGGYEIMDMVARTEGFLLAGDLDIAAQGGLQSAHISQARMDGVFDFSADIERSKEGAFVINGAAMMLDARGFVRGLAQGASADFGVALDADITFERALVSDQMILKQGKINFKRGMQEIEIMEFIADTPNGQARFVVSQNLEGQRQLSGRTDDAGLVIEALFGTNSVRGGVLQIDGVLGDGGSLNTKLELAMDNFKLSNVPAVARILTLGSLTGIANTMSGEGIGFKKLIAPLEFEKGTMQIGAARATGPALGVTVTGKVDLLQKTMALNGALAPAYSINSALGNIPVLGDVLVSRKGEGLFGLSYRVQGPFEELQVFVNPLSALTPGVFRRIFEGSKTPAGPDIPSDSASDVQSKPLEQPDSPPKDSVPEPTPEAPSDGGKN